MKNIADGHEPVVFVTQIPHKRVPGSRIWIAAINIAPASQFGQIQVMMPHQISILDTTEVQKYLEEALKHYDYQRGDSLLMIGDPAIIAVASAIVAEYTENFRILKWEKNENRYIPVEVHL